MRRGGWGEEVFKKAYSNQLSSFNRYIHGKGLAEGVKGEDLELSDALKEALERWNKIVDDMP